MLVRLYSKFLKLGFSNRWTENFPMYKVGLEKAQEPEIKLSTFVRSWRKQRNSRKFIYFCFIDYGKSYDCVDHNKLWKIHKEMGIPDQLTCLLRKLYVGQEATVRTRHGTDWFKTGKGVHHGCILSPCLFNLYAEYIMWNYRLDESEAGIKIARRNNNNLRHADDNTLMAESEEDLRVSWWGWKRRVKSWLKTQHSEN